MATEDELPTPSKVTVTHDGEVFEVVIPSKGTTMTNLKLLLREHTGMVPCQFELRHQGEVPGAKKKRKKKIKSQTTMELIKKKDTKCRDGENCKWEAACQYHHDDKRTTKTVCGHFIMGKCYYGPDCKYEHPDSSQTPSAMKKTTGICRHFIMKLNDSTKRGCTFGDSCRFSHEEPESDGLTTTSSNESIHKIAPVPRDLHKSILSRWTAVSQHLNEEEHSWVSTLVCFFTPTPLVLHWYCDNLSKPPSFFVINNNNTETIN